MPVREQASMGTTDFRAYARRKKVKKEETPSARPLIGQDQSVDLGGSVTGADAEPADRLLSLEMDVAEALVEFSRVGHFRLQQDKVLRWSCKRKRTVSSFSRDSVAPPRHSDEDLEDALSAIKKKRSACALRRDSSLSDRDEIESTRRSRDFSSISESRAQSPSSPLPLLQRPSGTLGTCGGADAKSAFQRVRPVAPCLVTVKAEVEDICSILPAIRHPQLSVRPKLKACKSSMGPRTFVKPEPGLDCNRKCPEESGVKSTATEVKGAGTGALNKAKSALSEEEKEARRLRRIQANRESARQTIRKKQVLCEDLSKKASNLALENGIMRQKRDSLMQELFCLKEQNLHLKQQLEKRSSGNVGHDTMASLPKDISDLTQRQPSQPASLSYAPPPAFFWAMAAAAAAAAAANQAYTLNKQEMWDASSTLQPCNSALVLSSSMPSFKQSPVPGSVQQNLSLACSDDSTLTGTDLPQKERGSTMNTCTRLPGLEGQCDDFSHDTTHSTVKNSNGDLSGNLACGTSMLPGSTLPQTTAAVQPALNSLCSSAATAKSMEFVQGQHMVQRSSAGLTYGHSVAGLSKANLRGQAMKGYAAMVAAEARRRRKELTRNKFARARALKSAVVS